MIYPQNSVSIGEVAVRGVYKKAVLKNFVIFTGKHLQSLGVSF